MDTILEFSHVCFSYPGGGGHVLDDVSFTLHRGERAALVGLNGSGKSTLLLHADALLLADSGTVRFGDTVATQKNAAQCRRSVGLVFQDPDDQLFMPTVEADVAFGPRNMGCDAAEIKRRVDRALEQTGCEGLRERAPFKLSGGQKKMVSVATVLSMTPEVLIFDEPTTGLDYEARRRFIDIVSPLPHTMLIASHDMELVKLLCSRALVMSAGRLVYDGPIDSMPFPK